MGPFGPFGKVVLFAADMGSLRCWFGRLKWLLDAHVSAEADHAAAASRFIHGLQSVGVADDGGAFTFAKRLRRECQCRNLGREVAQLHLSMCRKGIWLFFVAHRPTLRCCGAVPDMEPSAVLGRTAARVNQHNGLHERAHGVGAVINLRLHASDVASKEIFSDAPGGKPRPTRNRLVNAMGRLGERIFGADKYEEMGRCSLAGIKRATVRFDDFVEHFRRSAVVAGRTAFDLALLEGGVVQRLTVNGAVHRTFEAAVETRKSAHMGRIAFGAHGMRPENGLAIREWIVVIVLAVHRSPRMAVAFETARRTSTIGLFNKMLIFAIVQNDQLFLGVGDVSGEKKLTPRRVTSEGLWQDGPAFLRVGTTRRRGWRANESYCCAIYTTRRTGRSNRGKRFMSDAIYFLAASGMVAWGIVIWRGIQTVRQGWGRICWALWGHRKGQRRRTA